MRKFARTHALAGVSFTVPSGKVFGFIGPNGAGKTTAIGIMAGIDEPQSGDVLYDGVSMIQYPERFRKHVGFMPDSIPDSKDTTVAEYFDFYVRAFGMEKEAGAEALQRVRKFARLETLDRKFLGELSKGMKQQVSLARILLHDPSILLLDEPAAGLDPRARMELGEAVKRLAEAGKTIMDAISPSRRTTKHKSARLLPVSSEPEVQSPRYAGRASFVFAPGAVNGWVFSAVMMMFVSLISFEKSNFGVVHFCFVMLFYVALTILIKDRFVGLNLSGFAVFSIVATIFIMPSFLGAFDVGDWCLYFTPFPSEKDAVLTSLTLVFAVASAALIALPMLKLIKVWWGRGIENYEL